MSWLVILQIEILFYYDSQVYLSLLVTLEIYLDYVQYRILTTTQSGFIRYQSGNFYYIKDDEEAIVPSFLTWTEFKESYGENVSDWSYVNTLYKNDLGRHMNTNGLNLLIRNTQQRTET